MLNNYKQNLNAKSMSKFFDGFTNFFENDFVDKIIFHEFSKEFVLLPLLVKSKIYNDNN